MFKFNRSISATKFDSKNHDVDTYRVDVTHRLNQFTSNSLVSIV